MRIPSLLVLLLLLNSLSWSQTIQLEIVCSGVSPQQGSMHVGIFDNADDFKNKTEPVYESILRISDTISTHFFDNIDSGEYAVAVFHDINGDGALNKKKLGIPIEGVGFSGSLKNTIRPPDFDEASFSLQADTTLFIPVRYPKNK